MTLVLHPLVSNDRYLRALEVRHKVFGANSPAKTLDGGFFSDLFRTVTNLVTGLTDAIAGVMTNIVQTIKHIGETIALIVRAAIGDVKWSDVFHELGKVFQSVGAVLVYLNPATIAYDWLKTSPLTQHAFNELDKFTGGMITNAVNVSSLPWRAMRGDPITKQELILDALLIIQVASVIFAGPVAVGVMVGSWIGREVCDKQTQAKDACKAAFVIVGAAAGTWAQNSGYGWDASEWFTSDDVLPSVTATPSEAANFVAGDAAYYAALEAAAAASSTSFLTLLESGAEQYLKERGITEATREVISLCQRNGWMGDHECEIVGGIAEDYARGGYDMDWPDFLAEELAQIAADELIDQWFPPDSPEAIAIKKKKNYQVTYVDSPANTQTQGVNPGVLLMLAAGVGTLFMGMA